MRYVKNIAYVRYVKNITLIGYMTKVLNSVYVAYAGLPMQPRLSQSSRLRGKCASSDASIDRADLRPNIKASVLTPGRPEQLSAWVRHPARPNTATRTWGHGKGDNAALKPNLPSTVLTGHADTSDLIADTSHCPASPSRLAVGSAALAKSALSRRSLASP
jgi:hypothetical protein